MRLNSGIKIGRFLDVGLSVAITRVICLQAVIEEGPKPAEDIIKKEEGTLTNHN